MSKPKPPKPPDVAAATAAGVKAEVDSFPLIKQIEAAAKLGTTVTITDPDSGEQKTYDFTGFGDVDQSRAELEFMAESARTIAQTQLDIQEEFGEDFVRQSLEQLKQSDPTGFEIREAMGEMVKDDLEAGYGIGEGLRNQITQGIRGGQAARGNVFGDANVAAEAFAVGDAAIRLRQQRLANASSFLAGITPVAQFGAISGAQQGAAAFNPMGIQQGATLNPNAGALGQQFAMQSYQQQSTNAFKAAEMNPFNTMLGTVGGLATAGLGGGIAGALSGGATGGAGKGIMAFLGGGK